MTVAGKQLTRYTFDELLDVRTRYAQMVQDERDQAAVDAGRRPTRHRQIRFVRPV